MKLYELYILLKPTLKEEEVNEFSSQLGELLAQAGFNVDASAVKPNERLTYNIQHFRQAHNLTLEISGGEEFIFPEAAEEMLRRDENVLRHLIFAKSEKMILKRAKQTSVLDQLHRERRTQAARQPEDTTSPTPPAETSKADIEEIDKKLEEILK